jgi:hypothetical protein
VHDLFANLLTKTADPFTYAATDYVAAPGYWVYRYYAKSMTGTRVKTTASTDTKFDVYATVGTDRVRILTGVKLQTGTYTLQVANISALGLPSSGSVSIDTWGFLGSDPLTPTGAPAFLNTVSHTYSGNVLSFPVYQTETHSAYAFEWDK